MTSPLHSTTANQMSPPHRLRLELNAAATGPVDGFWWPHGRDLAAELPALLAMLVPVLGSIQRVVYHLDEWSSTPRKLDVGGRQVRLDGYRHMPARILEVHGVEVGARLTLRLITPIDDTDMVAAQQRWDSEGGAVSARERAASR
ncbi:DUF5994 family protein [Nocardia concava]|uniref:DUF5994 family protein n=1 Tax=Nocardia concava TaxID=257281 RepID=UPI0002FFEB54|nr:DUF5994 family protein [Nocardia concava]